MAFKDNLPSGLTYSIEQQDGHGVLKFWVSGKDQLMVTQIKDIDDVSHASLTTELDAKQASALRDFLTVALDLEKSFRMPDNP